MQKYRFYCHTWEPGVGHKDTRYLKMGTDPSDAMEQLLAVLKKRQPRMIVNVKFWEKIS